MSESGSPHILCFGEVLWDSLPAGLFPGGAPLNVAYHLRMLGLAPIVVSAVGRDRLGEEMRRRFDVWGLDARGVRVDPTRETGLSRVALVDGSPRYEIVEGVAWDEIEASPEILELARSSVAIVFGSLAQRSPTNRTQLRTLLAANPAALKVFDVNLRRPFDSSAIVWSLASAADLVKLNVDELAALLGETLSPADFEIAVRRFARRAGVDQVCLTAGALGAGLLLEDRWAWRPSRPVAVRDSVGAGDAFLAALLFGRLRRAESPAATLRRACRLARVVVSRDGATPAYGVDSEGNVVA